MKLFLFLTLWFFSITAGATTFKKFTGTYKITYCENQSTAPTTMHEDVCESLLLLIDPASYMTNFHFVDGGNQVKTNFNYLPERSLKAGNAKYEEFEDEEAKYIVELKDYSMFTRIKKVQDNQYHLSLYTQFRNKEDLFEIELEKVSDKLTLPRH